MTSYISGKEAKQEFQNLMARVQPKDIPAFLEHVVDSYSVRDDGEKQKYVRDAFVQLMKITKHVKQQVPTKGYLKSEKICWPKAGYDSDCNEKNTVHVDCFLFDDTEVEELVKRGVLSRNFCVDCGSKNTKPLNFISHSLAANQLEFMFTSLIPLISQKEDFCVVDIGSRLGAVIFAANLFSTGKSHAIGIEMNEDLCKVQRKTIEDFNLSNITVISADVRTQEETIHKADLVVMNNVFAFFLDKAEQESCWEFLHSSLKPGTQLIHHPSIHEVTSHLDLTFNIDDWLERVNTDAKCAQFSMMDEELYEDCNSLHLYKVKSND